VKSHDPLARFQFRQFVEGSPVCDLDYPPVDMDDAASLPGAQAFIDALAPRAADIAELALR